MKNLKILFFLGILTLIIPVTLVTAEDSEGILDCSLAIMPDGYHFITDIWDNNFTTVDHFDAYLDYELRVYIDNYANKTLSIYLPDFDNPKTVRFQNETLEINNAIDFFIKADVEGIFIIETLNINQTKFKIIVGEQRYAHFYNQPLMITLVSFPLAVITGTFGMVSQQMKGKRQKKTIKNKEEEIKKNGAVIVYENPRKITRTEIREVYDRIRKIENIPIAKEDIESSFEQIVHGIKYRVLEPEILIETTEGMQAVSKETIKQVLSQIPDTEKVNLSINHRFVKLVDIQNETEKALIESDEATISLLELIKNISDSKTMAWELVGRYKTENRALRSELVNARQENKALDEALVYGEGAITNAGIYNIEKKEQSFFSKFKLPIISTAVLLGLGIVVILVIWIVNNIPVTAGG